jgi:hypothetical protein
MCIIYIHRKGAAEKRGSNDTEKRVAEMCIISTTRFYVLWTIRNTQIENDGFKSTDDFYIREGKNVYIKLYKNRENVDINRYTKCIMKRSGMKKMCIKRNTQRMQQEIFLLYFLYLL